MDQSSERPSQDRLDSLRHLLPHCWQDVLVRVHRECDRGMVHNAVWAEARLEPDGGGWVHLSCLSRRLGRPLVQADFPFDVPANEWQPWEES